MGITRLGLKRPVSAFMLILAIAVFGIGSLFGFQIEMLPEVNMPVLMVRTAYEGADPETVDETVSKVIEQTAEILNGVESVETYSYEDYSMLMLHYGYDVDLMEAHLKLQNALAEMKHLLPAEAGEPVVLEMNVDAESSIQISAHAEDEKEITAFLNEGMLVELQNLPTVAKVDVYGGAENYIRIELKEYLLSQYGLNMETVAQYIAASDFSVPVGSVTQGKQNLDVTSYASRNTVEEIKEIPLQGKDGALLRLSDVADIYWTVNEADHVSRFNGEENVTIYVTKNQRATAMALSKDVSAVLEKYEKQSADVDFELFYDGGEEVVASAKTLGLALIAGMILAMIVVGLFFGNLKTSFAAGSAALLSLFVPLIGAQLAGFSLNVVTLAAVVIAMGIITDTTIFVLDKCFQMKGDGISRKEAAIEGAASVKKSVIASVISTIAVCIPLALMEGFSAQLFAPFGFIIVFAAAASFLSAAVFVPLFFVMFKLEKETSDKIAEKFEKLEQKYDSVVRKLLAKKYVVVAAAIFLFAISCAAVIYTDTELIPQSDSGTINVNVEFRSGIQNAKIEEKILILEELIEEYLEVDDYTVTADKSSATIAIKLKKGSRLSYEKFGEDLKEKTKNYAGIDISVSNASSTAQYGDYEGEETILAGYKLEDVKAAASDLTARYRKIPGALAVFSSVETEATKLEIKIDSLSAMNYGLTSAQVAQSLRKLVNGQDVMVLSEGGRDYTVRLEFADGVYSTPQNLMNVNIPTPEGGTVPLSEIAVLEYTDAQECNVRRDGKYLATVTVTCLEKYRNLVKDDMTKEWLKMEDTTLVTREKSDVQKLMDEEFITLLKALGMVVFLIFVVLSILFESPKYALMLMFSIPLGLFGAFLLMFVTGSAWNLMAIMGVLLLAGIVVNNGIRYGEAANQLSKTIDMETALVESGKLRLKPILVTAAAVIAVLLPMAVWPGQGTVMMRDMAIVIIGGIASAAVLILLVFPVFYLLMYGKMEDEEEEELPEIEEVNV